MKWVLSLIALISFHAQSQTKAECDKFIQDGISKMLKAEHTNSLELLTRAASIAQEHGWHKQHFLALNNIGANYYNMLDYGEALQHYLEAYTLSIRNLGPQQEMTALNNIGILYLSDRDYAKAKEYMSKAYDLAEKTDNKKKIVLYSVNLALVCNAQNQLSEARKYLDKASSLASANPDAMLEAKIVRADNLFRSGEYNAAKALALENLNEIDKDALPKHHLETLLTLSKIAQKENKIQQAIEYAKSSLSINSDQEAKVFVYEQLASLYADSKQYPLALNAKDSVIHYQEALNTIRNGRVYENNRVKFEIENYQKQLRENVVALEESQDRLYQFVGGGLVCFVLIGWGTRTRYISAKQSKIILERDNELISLELEKKKSDNQLLEEQMRERETNALLEQERLRNEIETRNRKLSAKALFLIERNELIGSLLQDLSSVSSLKGEPVIDRQIIKLKSLLKSDDEWDDFVSHFDETNHGLLSALRQRHPLLTGGDLRYISYVYMNLSHKEIASLLNITPEACRKRKERVSKKLGLDDSAGLLQYLSELA